MSAWGDRLKDAWSQLLSWTRLFTSKATAVAAALDADPSAVAAPPPFSSLLFLATTAVFLFQVTQRIPRARTAVPVAPDLDHPPLPRPRVNILRRLARLVPLTVAQDALLREVLYSWLLAEAFALWLWAVGRMDVLLDAYWLKMAEVFPPSAARAGGQLQQQQQPAASLSVVLPLVLGKWSGGGDLPAPEGATHQDPDLSQLPCFLETALRPAFLRPIALFLLALLPLVLIQLLPPRQDDAGVGEEEVQGVFWLPFNAREGWGNTEMGSSGYFLEREQAPASESSEGSPEEPTPSQSEDFAMSPVQEGPTRRSRSRSRRPRRRLPSHSIQLKTTRST